MRCDGLNIRNGHIPTRDSHPSKENFNLNSLVPYTKSRVSGSRRGRSAIILSCVCMDREDTIFRDNGEDNINRVLFFVTCYLLLITKEE